MSHSSFDSVVPCLWSPCGGGLVCLQSWSGVPAASRLQTQPGGSREERGKRFTLTTQDSLGAQDCSHEAP